MTNSRLFSPASRARGVEHATARNTEPAIHLVSWGELLWDLFPDGARLGGAAANLAYHAAQLGCHSLLVSRVGDDDLGRRALEELGRAGVDLGCVQIDAEAATGSVRVEVNDGEPRFSIEQRAAWDAIAYDAALATRLGGADVFCYNTLAQRQPLGSRALSQALADVGPDCIRFCDLNLRPPFFDAETVIASVSSADVVKLNQAEADYLARHTGGRDVQSWLFDRGVELVALTRGAGGALLATPSERFEHPGLAAEAGGDSVGAGDAFSAALAFHLARATELGVALERASRLGAYVASRTGAMPPLPDTLLQEVRSVLTARLES